MTATTTPNFTATRNACKLCTPLGACFVFRGIEGGVPLLHGSQGCATYIRRYMISHFKEPVDIASSSFSESAAIFGGGENLWAGLDNVLQQYHPKLIGVASTCLSETIGDDVRMFLHEYRRARVDAALPPIVHVSTPSYSGTHAEGFHNACREVIDALTTPGPAEDHVNMLPGMVSPADLRYLKELVEDFGLPCVMLPDYSDTLDGGAWSEYHRIPEGGTPLADIERTARARGTIEFGCCHPRDKTAGHLLQTKHDVPHHRLGLPIGVTQTDVLIDTLEEITGRKLPEHHRRERGRLIDALVDAHKHVFGRRAVVYGEEDLVVATTAFLLEIGIEPVLCASGGSSGRLKENIQRIAGDRTASIVVKDEADFLDIEDEIAAMAPDILIGSSKGYTLSRKLELPLVRIGFPIHDRIGGARLMHLGYRGAQQLFDRIANALIERKQAVSPVGYTYM